MRVISGVLLCLLSCHSLAKADPAVDAAAPQDPAAAADPSPAAPPAQDAKSEAIERFRRGLELYEEGDFSAALVELRRATELAPSYKLHYNLGQVCYQLADYACAINSFQEYLSGGGDSIASDRRSAVEKDIQKLNHRVARIELVTNVAGAKVTIDDKHIGYTPLSRPVVVNAGTRKITAYKDGMLPATRMIELPGSDAVRVVLTLQPLGGSSARVDRQVLARSAADETPSRWTTLSWVGLGASGALATGAVITGILAKGAADDLNSMRFAGESPPEEVRSQSSATKRLAITSDVFTLTSVATLATTLVLTLTGEPAKEKRPNASGLRAGFTGSRLTISGEL